jgi:phage repressor protein C with HTH and peptisase S24 domain
MNTQAAKRLREVRKKAGHKSASAFAAAHGLLESGYRHKENGTRQITVEDAKQFAHLLSLDLGQDISWQYLLDENAAVGGSAAQLRGYVGAGEAVHPFTHEDPGALEPLPAPPGMETASAYKVRGESMNPVYREGDILFFAGAAEPPNQLLGKDCMVQVTDGARLIKNLRKGSKRGHYRLYSYATDTESDDVRLDWAAPVKWVQRG